jgi:hypothetical protein
MLQKRIGEKLEYYKDRKKQVPKMKERLEELRAIQAKLEKQIFKEPTPISLSGEKKKKKKQKLTVQDGMGDTVEERAEKLASKHQKLKAIGREISKLEKEVESIEDGKELMNYQMEAAKYLLDYEQEKQVEQRAMAEMKKAAPSVSRLGSFLDRLPSGSTPPLDRGGNDYSADGVITKPTSADEENETNLFAVLQPNLGIGRVQSRPSTNQKEVYAEYLWRVENDSSKRQHLLNQEAERNQNVCSQPQCRGELAEDHENDHMLVCKECGCSEIQLPDTDVGTYNEPIIPIQPAFAYKKKNHFRDWLAKSQGKENTTIPEVVYDSLLNEFRKMRITRAEDVTRQIIRDLLTKLKMPKYYHNISQIHYHLTGKHPPQFTR